MGRLGGKIAVVTAAGSGIGRATALAFVREGARVYAVDLNGAATQETVELARASRTPGEILAHTADVSHAEEVESLFARTRSETSRLDVLVHGVGISGRRLGDGPVDECTEAGWDQVFDVNVKSAYLCCHHAIPQMTAGGSIIQIGSVLGLVGGGEQFATHAYAASKGALAALTRAMATYYAPRSIRVNLIAPGLIDTPMSARAQADPELMAHVSRMQPLRRVAESLPSTLGQADDVAAAAVYLASDEAAFVTGVILPVDGGWTAQ
jgi:NAD(P)-dependent dehydrogenase (short-subunit alcohol dehydrogenase family)